MKTGYSQQNLVKTLSPSRSVGLVLIGVAVAVLSVVYTEYDTILNSTAMSMAIAAIVVTGALRAPEHQRPIYVVFPLLFLPVFPRDILFVYDQISAGQRNFLIYTTTQVMGLPLTVITMLTIGLARLSVQRCFAKRLSLVLIILTLIPLQAVLSGVFSGCDTASMLRMSKPFIVTAILLVCFVNLRVELQSFLAIVFLSSSVIGVRVLLLVFHDLITDTNLAFSFQTVPVISALSILWAINSGLHVPLRSLLSLVFVQRAEIFFISLIFSFGVVTKIRTWKPMLYAVILIIVAIVSLDIFGLSGVYKFIIWKITSLGDFFVSPEVGSGGVRLLEIKNILSQYFVDPITLWFGGGASATYGFSAYPFGADMVIDLKSYTEAEIATGEYFTTHSFFAFMLLYSGIQGVFVYIFLCVLPFSFFTERKVGSWIFRFLACLVCVYYSYANITGQLLLAAALAGWVRRGSHSNYDRL